jgi:hypothetical protein
MGKEKSSAVPGKMIVGMNYPHPWNAFGVYLGGGSPPGSQPGIDVWTTNLLFNLFFMKDQLNLRVVRIFLLGNAFNYGSFKPTGGTPLSRFGSSQLFVPPKTLHPKFGEHVTAMFQAFQTAGMLVIPSLIDFKAFGRPLSIPNGCTGKFDIAANDATRRIFFKQVLDEFLRLSVPFRDVIYAWEVQNEPFWNISSFLANAASSTVAGGPTLSAAQEKTFLNEALALMATGVQRHATPNDNVLPGEHFQTTVGHRFLSDLSELPTGTKRQFHYYPFSVGPDSGIGPIIPRFFLADGTLPPFSETNAFLGEIGIEPPSAGHGDLWAQVNGLDNTTATNVRVRERLQFVQSQGYPMVLMWPDGVDGPVKEPPFPGPDPVKLSSGAQQGILEFMRTQ